MQQQEKYSTTEDEELKENNSIPENIGNYILNGKTVTNV